MTNKAWIDPDNKMIYLDNAATSHPKPEEVYRRVDDVLRNVSANPGRSGHRMALDAARVIFDAREDLAALLGIPHPDRIIFTPNATAAINIALKGLLKPGDHAVTTTMEHNSVVRPLVALGKAGVRMDKVSASGKGELDPDDVAAAFTKDTKLVAMTHASNVIGTITPVRQIADAAHEQGVLVLLDAAQTAGVMPLDIGELGVDLLACPGHKGLYGPQGTGFLYIGPDVTLKPTVFGGTGSRSDLDVMPDFLPDRYEAGTLNTPGIAGLGAGAGFILREGAEKIRAHEVSLCRALIDGLKAVDGVTVYGVDKPEARASVVSFNIEGIDPAEIGNLLDTGYDIAVRVGIHCAPDAHRTMGSYPGGAVRISPGYFNTQQDIKAAVEAVVNIARGA